MGNTGGKELEGLTEDEIYKKYSTSMKGKSSAGAHATQKIDLKEIEKLEKEIESSKASSQDKAK